MYMSTHQSVYNQTQNLLMFGEDLFYQTQIRIAFVISFKNLGQKIVLKIKLIG